MDKLIIAPGTNPDQFYATGLKLHGQFITLARGTKRYVAAGGFEYPQAAQKYSALRLEELGKTRREIIAAFLKKYKVKSPLMPATTTARAFAAVPGARIVDNIFPQRTKKSKKEIAEIKKSQKATEAAITAVRDTLAAAKIINGKAKIKGKWLTSEQLKRIASVELAKFRCSCPDMIISSGAQTRLPHDEGSGVIREGSVIVDIFPRSDESFYYSDCTRTFVVGKTPKNFDERYAAIIEVHRKCAKAARHDAKNIELIAKKVFADFGFITDYVAGTGYIHSLGHGVGLDVHEEPRLSGKLIRGNVITLEPGLYYDYGIRVEDIGLVTKNGFSNFVKLSKNPYI